MANTQTTNNARMTDINTIRSAGIDPKTGLPIRMLENCNTKADFKKHLRIMDEQDAVNRFTYYNLPKGLNGQLIERILYYRGQGAFFKLQDTFYFLPYALDGTIDVYGRFTGITPLPFNGTQTNGNDKDTPWIQGLKFTPRYEIADIADYINASNEEIEDAINRSCVLLHDYTPQISQTNIARSQLQDPLLDIMANCIPFMNTALLNSTGIGGMRVANENEKIAVDMANSSLQKAALEGKKFVGVVGSLDFQELVGGNVAKAEEFMLALQSLDNYRLSLYGLDNGGLFTKKAHMLEAEQETQTGHVALVANDGLYNRQMALTILNSYFGTAAWVEPNESTLGLDKDMDGKAGEGAENEKPMSSPANNNAGGTTNNDAV